MKKIKVQQEKKEAEKTKRKCKGHNCCENSPRPNTNTRWVRGFY